MLDSFREAFSIERFRQIVDRMYIKGAQRILVIRCNKNDERESRDIEVKQDVEPVEVGHLYIQKHEVWILISNRIDCFASISRFANYFNLRVLFQHLANSIAGERFIVNNQRFDQHRLLTVNKCRNIQGHAGAALG